MRVSILISDLTVKGGAPRQAMLLARELQELGHQATLYASRYCPKVCYPEIAATLDVRAVERLSPAASERKRRRHHAIFSGAKRHLWESRQLAELVGRECTDILNPHVRGATRAAVLCKQRMGAPVVWMCDDARNWEEPGYRTYYAPRVQSLFDHVMAQLEQPVVREIDRIITLDHRVKGILESFYGRPTEVIRSGLDASSFSKHDQGRVEIRTRHGIADGDFLLLWLGILEPHRRIEDTLEALQSSRLRGRKDIRFLIAGSGRFAPEYVRKLSELAEQYGLQDRVDFRLDAVPESEMADYYSAADALVYLPQNQCWGLSVFEAMACDLPTLVSRACGAHEVLEDRVTAMLVPPRNADELARAIIELADNPALQKAIVARAHVRVLDQITWKSYAQNMLRVFEQVLAEQSSSATAASREVFA